MHRKQISDALCKCTTIPKDKKNEVVVNQQLTTSSTYVDHFCLTQGYVNCGGVGPDPSAAVRMVVVHYLKASEKQKRRWKLMMLKRRKVR